MADLWMPNATRMQGAHKGGNLIGGAPRMIHHITWDAIDANGNPPRMEDVAGYLISKGYEPHLMIDPVEGRIIQFLPFNTSGYAVSHTGDPETNRLGSACIQIEWFFTPGVVRNGVKYATLADTPMAGWGDVLRVANDYGIPQVWPLGEPQWSGNSRDVNTWVNQAGHYGHCHVPENDHTDPGPMPSFNFSAAPSAPSPSPSPAPASPAATVLSRGSSGPAVASLQNQLNIKGFGPLLVDGQFGQLTEAAVRKAQTAMRITVDGLAGPQTLSSLDSYSKASPPPARIILAVDGSFGPNTVSRLQQVVGASVDGSFGPQTRAAMQRWLGVTADGVVGPVTVKALQARVGAVQDGEWGPATTSALQTYLNGLG